MEIRALRPEDDRTGFESGNAEIDDFLRRFAGQNQWRHHVGVTYGIFAGARIVGFVTLSAGNVRPRELPADASETLPRYDAPVLRLARLGVARQFQSTGLGRELLHVAATIAFEMRARVGCIGIVCDAKPESVGFYERHGFRELTVTSRMAGAGAPPVRLFVDLRYLARGALAAGSGVSTADSLATEMQRRTRELGLSQEEVRVAVRRLLGSDT